MRRADPNSVILRLGSLIMVSLLAFSLVCAQVASAATGGVAVIYKSDASGPLNSGGSSSLFGLALPQGARCPGDSAHPPYYHLFSYLVPAGVDPASVSYKMSVPSRGLGLIAAGEYYGGQNTARDTGMIINLPNNFDWTRITPALVLANGATSAIWAAGIACVDGTGVTRAYWNVDIRFSASSSDPRGFTWSAVAPVHPSSGVPWAVIAPLLIAAVLALIAVRINARNRQRRISAGSD